MRIIGIILLFLLKFIGILVLLLAGLFLLILLVPIRYRLCGKAGPEETFVKGRVSWLCSLVRISFDWQGSGDVSCRLRILGISVFPGKKKEREDIPKAVSPEAVDEPVSETAKAEADSFSERAKAEIEKTISEMAEPVREENLSQRAGEEIEKILSGAAEAGEISEDETKDDEEESVKNRPAADEETAENVRPEIGGEEREESEEKTSRADSEETKPDAEEKAAEGKLRSIPHKIRQVKVFLQKEEHQAAFTKIRRELKRIVRHLLPTRLRIRGIFGFSDPALTGKVLGVFGLLLPLYREAVQVTPDFTCSRLEGEVFLKGRVRLGTLGASAVRLLLDKNIRKWIRQVW